MAIFAAATPTWLKRAIRFDSLKSMYLRGSKFLSSATVFTGRSETSKVVAIPRPERPSIKLSQNSLRVLPFGASTPMPVTTTRCSRRTPFPSMSSCYERGRFICWLLRCDHHGLHRSGNRRDDLLLDGIPGYADGVVGRPRIGAAMGDDGNAVDTQENGPTELAPIGAPADRPELGTDQEPAERRQRVAT